MLDLVDTHCHLDFGPYNDDLEAVVARAHEAGVRRIIIPATQIEALRGGIELSEQFSGVFAAVGVHPTSTATFDPDWIEAIEIAANHKRVVAIGEIGLDYYWDKSPIDVQKRAFQAQLELARKLELPVIIHNREASNDVMTILQDWVSDLPETLRNRPGVLHSFSAPMEIAERAIAAGFYLGFTGPLTFKNAGDLREVAAKIPLERILVETDGPFLTPVPHRGKRNEPAYIPHIVERLAMLRQISMADMAQITTANAQSLFQFSDD